MFERSEWRSGRRSGRGIGIGSGVGVRLHPRRFDVAVLMCVIRIRRCSIHGP